MAIRRYNFALGEFYHVYNRGTDKRTIYKDAADYKRFIELLFLSNTLDRVNVRDIKYAMKSVYDFAIKQKLVHIGAYCLMPNHFHILITPARENGVQLFMQKLSTGYAMYFNRKYERTGGLFEGKFKSELVESDEYLKYLFTYIHLNPIKLIQSDWKERGIQDVEASLVYLSDYKHSSYIDFSRGLASGKRREEEKILSRSKFPEYFLNPTSFETEMREWLTFSNTELPSLGLASGK